MSRSSLIQIYTKEEIETLREGGVLLFDILQKLKHKTTVGVTTEELDTYAHQFALDADAVPAFLNYQPQGSKTPFPASICISVNHEVVHGIPNKNPKILKKGDVVVLDMGLKYKNLFTDSAITVVVGGDEENKIGSRMIEVAEEALSKAINMVKPGIRTGTIGHTISASVLQSKTGFTVPIELGGHGIGKAIHEDPFIPNFGKKGEGVLLREGMVIAIEPILTEKKSRIKLASDGYTYVTADGGLSVHVEHTIVVTKDGAEILTTR